MGKLTLSASLLFMNENEVKSGGVDGEKGEGGGTGGILWFEKKNEALNRRS